ncbi:MAG: TrkA C-terminal domain-containing protein, partial [Bacteroidaceae bacterium]
PKLNGKRLSELNLNRLYGVNVTRIYRGGIDLVATDWLQLQVGDRMTVVGTEISISNVEKTVGNSIKGLDQPNLVSIFIGIALGIILGSIPIWIPGIPQPLKLGLAGGPLIISIIISRFGYHYKLITFTTPGANFMLRELGIAIFLACVGIGAGSGFWNTIMNGGLVWVGYGLIITIIPLLVVGMIGRYFFKINYFTLSGMIAGCTTDPPALAYANATAGNDAPAVGYAAVYPISMFLRIVVAQLMILFFI